MSFINDALVATGSVALAFAFTDLVRNYFPNYYRIAVPVLLLGAVDAYIPQFTFLSWGFQVGVFAAIGGGIWFLRKKAVIRQDGTRDNG